MKKLILLIIGILLTICVQAQIKVGQTIPPIKFTTILNAREKTIALSDLKGKVIWLEFWATWCGPCVEAMSHLQELQKQFGKKLQVIAISTEKEKRISQFITNRPSNLWFAADTADKLREFFPYHIIPHSVLIDGSGKVVAITEPANITNKIIADVIAGKPINLPLKEDNTVEDPIKTYFNAADTVQNRFLLRLEIKGVSSMSKKYPTDSIFKNRRITIINLSLQSIYRIAYMGLPYDRVIDLTPKENISQNKTNYCVDIIVPKGHEAELYSILIKELQSRFDLKAVVEKRNKDVYVLKIADTVKIKLLKISTDKTETFEASHGAFNERNVKLGEIADYLESFGLVSMPVVDETNSNIKYDIAFDYLPEKKGSLINAIANLGLKLEKGQREIDMLVFR